MGRRHVVLVPPTIHPTSSCSVGQGASGALFSRAWALAHVSCTKMKWKKKLWAVVSPFPRVVPCHPYPSPRSHRRHPRPRPLLVAPCFHPLSSRSRRWFRVLLWSWSVLLRSLWSSWAFMESSPSSLDGSTHNPPCEQSLAGVGVSASLFAPFRAQGTSPLPSLFVPPFPVSALAPA